MKYKKTFTTIFTDTENFHLVKDVGQLPYFMYKTEGFEGQLISYKNNDEYQFLKHEVKGLKLNFIPNRGRFLYFEIGILSYLWAHSKSIDVLNLFHFKKDNFLYFLLYKTLNPKGKTYLKLDMDIHFFKNYNTFLFSNYKLKNRFLQILTKWIFKLTDHLSVETEEAKEYLELIYPKLNGKLICIPNGVDNLYLDQEIAIKPFHEKENIMLTIGRIGTEQKNTELFLEALSLIDLKDWKVYIIGPIEEGFYSYIDKFYNDFPSHRDKIIFTGNIANRKELFDFYNRAKIFCLSSRFEGFPITFPEALYFGNYILSTPVSSAAELTSKWKYGTLAPTNSVGFSKAIQDIITDGFLNEELFQNIRMHSKEKFSWPAIISKLAHKLND